MKKWLNTLFFGSCFITSLILEMYCILIFEGNPISASALGIVVLIMGYLFMDSIRSWLIKSSNDMKFYYDHIMKEEMERWNERYTEINNLQKATYTATKKTAELLADRMEVVLQRLDDLEDKNDKALQRMLGLQKKSLEGQKTALNLEINYNKENTNRILEALSADDTAELRDRMNYIISLLERNSEPIKEYTGPTAKEASVIHQVNMPTGGFIEDSFEDREAEPENDIANSYITDREAIESDVIDSADMDSDRMESDIEFENTSATIPQEPDTEAEDSNISGEENSPKITPLYEDPNKALSADEIAALFASFGQ